MPHWLVRGHNGSVGVEAASWMAAVRIAAPDLGLDPASFEHLNGRFAPSGAIRVQGATKDARVLVHDVPKDMLPSAQAQDLLEFDEIERQPPSASMTEQIFESAAVIHGAEDAKAACAVALELLHDIVPAESGSVLLSNGSGLIFVAAYGRKSANLANYRIHYGFGLAGWVFETQRSVVVEDVQHNRRHLHSLDAVTGYHPKSVLAVPVDDGNGRCWGVIELLDPTLGFVRWELDAAQSIAKILGESLTARVDWASGLPPVSTRGRRR